MNFFRNNKYIVGLLAWCAITYSALDIKRDLNDILEKQNTHIEKTVKLEDIGNQILHEVDDEVNIDDKSTELARKILKDTTFMKAVTGTVESIMNKTKMPDTTVTETKKKNQKEK
ncbi:MAG: hypothetical protein K8I03_09655 [Ignavibacteria bacterium]|nr:hypothetical protein [Ignavibacteria bacterium]